MLENEISSGHFLEPPWHPGRNVLIFTAPVSHTGPAPKAASKTVSPPLFLHSFPFQLREASPSLGPPGWPHGGRTVGTGVSVGGRVDAETTEEAKGSQDD